VEAGVHVARAVEVRVVDEALPPRRGAGLLEVDPHRDAEVLLELARPCPQPARVVEGRLGVVHAAGTDDHEQAIVLAADDLRDLRAPAEHDLRVLLAQRQVVEELRRRHQRHDVGDSLVAYPVRVSS
jgi:hypothetical protein